MIKLFLGILVGGAIGAGMGYYGKCTSGTCPLTANPWRGSLYGACMGALFTLAMGGLPLGTIEQVPREVRAEGKKQVVHIDSAASFNYLLSTTEKPILLDIYADWCAPCRSMEPTIDKLAVDFEGKAVIAKLNIDRVPDVAKQYGVAKIPTVLVFSNGDLVETIQGANTSDRYADVLDRLIDIPSIVP